MGQSAAWTSCRMFKMLAFCPLPYGRTRPQVHPAPSASRPRRPIAPLFAGLIPSHRPTNPARSRLILPRIRTQGSPMPEVIFTGPAGRLEGRYHPAKQKNAPIAMVLHPHPQFSGTMNHQIIYQCYYAFVHRGLSVLRFNFRGVVRSLGSFDHGTTELSAAASALDWRQTINPAPRARCLAPFSFASRLAIQLPTPRPHFAGFLS